MVYPLSGTTGPYTASPSHALALFALGRLAHTAPYPHKYNKTALKVPIRAHRLLRRFQAARFRLPPGERALPAPVRPSYTIWELWCFLALVRAFTGTFPDWRWRERLGDQLKLLCGVAQDASVEGSGPDGSRLALHFNLTFRSLWASQLGSADAAYADASKRFSLSSERRPDIVVQWMPDDGSSRPAWMCLDAKYRQGRENIGAAMESAHIYRDALVDGPLGGRPGACLLLVPSKVGACDRWFLPDFWDKYGLGAAVLSPAPGGDDSVKLVAWLVQRLQGETAVLEGEFQASSQPVVRTPPAHSFRR